MTTVYDEAAIDALTKTATSASCADQLYLLRLYGLYPKRADADVVVSLLLSAMPQVDPPTHYTSCALLIPIHLVRTPDVQACLAIGDMVQSGRFASMWDLVHHHSALFERHAGVNFVERMRAYIAAQIGATFSTIRLANLKVLLDTDDCRAVCERQGWKVAQGDLVEVGPGFIRKTTTESLMAKSHVTYNQVLKMQEII
ncbi:CSN8/PSMD8/EIF3K domain-containing protein [Plasmodiophora brassicae]|uniref:CSN8/PSMD8/EIF3K domain-containing protein n=1 Tax=Plasmodiophora brassicae TaxID=37360 RepID=A0A0G4IU22_PLABS|nr:hypothetical protein PBRA_006884 [Plasmodiophora brassicae]